jgi:hypothetical protein
VVRERRLDAVAGVVGERQLIVPVGAIELWWVKRAPCSASLRHQLRGHLGHALHVAAVLGVQHLAR